MRLKNTRKMALMLAGLLCMGMLSGCSTKVGEHSSTYFKQMSYVFTTAAKNASGADVASSLNPNALLAPGNFTVDEDGSYSFDGVENAQYYYIYVYSNSTTKDAAAQSEKIVEDGSGTYTGSLSDFANLTYQDWTVRVVAYPDANGELKASPASSVTYTKSGAVDYGEPQLYYMWSLASKTLTIKVDDMEYGNTAYPTNIHLTLTNDADAGDVIELDIDDISSFSATASTTAAKEDATYSIKADFTWDADFVSNPEYSVSGAEAQTSSTENKIAGDFYYSSAIFKAFDFPHVQENFDPVQGGQAGMWFNNGSESSTRMPWETEAEDDDTDTNAYFEATPKAAENGAEYSYDIIVSSPSGSITATPKLSPGGATTKHIFGTLDIYADGTFKMNIEYQYLRTDSMNAAVYYVPGVECDGIYSVNADGTLNLSYDHENAKETDYDIVQEVTGKAAEWLAEHPDEALSESPMMGGPMPGGPGAGGPDAAGGDENGAPTEEGAPAEGGAPAEEGAAAEGHAA